jgi:hypothetical protein
MTRTRFLSAVKLLFWVALIVIRPANAADSQPCEAKVINSVSRIAAKQLQKLAVISSQCKRWLFRPDILLSAVSYEVSGYNEIQDGRQITIIIAAVDATSRIVLASYMIDASEDSGTRFNENSMHIDTARYDVAPGLRAFGLRLNTGYGPSCAEGGSSDFLTLFLFDGNELLKILDSLPLSRWRVAEGRSCGGDKEPVREEASITLSVAKTMSHGFNDLLLSAKTDPYDRTLYRVIKYDGQQYSIKQWSDAFESFWDSGRRVW